MPREERNKTSTLKKRLNEEKGKQIYLIIGCKTTVWFGSTPCRGVSPHAKKFESRAM